MDDCWIWCHSFRATEKEFSKYGGRSNGFQLWVNLPKNKKMMTPRYQEIHASKIPSACTKDSNITVKVIADESLGAKAGIDTITPILYLHFNENQALTKLSNGTASSKRIQCLCIFN